MICRSNVFFINNPDPELRLKPDPDPIFLFFLFINNFGSTTLVSASSLSTE
jgi:hypothetical protein